MHAGNASGGVKRVAFIAASSTPLLDLQVPLIADLVRRRHKVLCLAPNLSTVDVTALKALGAAAEIMALRTSSLNPFADFLLRRQWTATLNAYAPHAVVMLDLATSALLSSSASRAGVARIVATLPKVPSGLDDASSDSNPPAQPDHSLVRDLRKTLAAATNMIVYTSEDRRALIATGWLRPETSVHVTAAGGIDLAVVTKATLPVIDHGFVFYSRSRS